MVNATENWEMTDFFCIFYTLTCGAIHGILEGNEYVAVFNVKGPGPGIFD